MFTSETRGAACWFANEYGETPIEFPHLGINLTVLSSESFGRRALREGSRQKPAAEDRFARSLASAP